MSGKHRQADINIETAESLARIESKVDQVLELEHRVVSLERWRTFLTGAWAVVTVAAGWLVKLVKF